MPLPLPNPDKPLSFTLHEMVWALDKIADAILRREFGVSYSRFHLLAVLAGISPSTQHELAACMGVTDAVVSRMLGSMAAAGWVGVANDPGHGRRRLVSITAEGVALLEWGTAKLEEALGRTIQASGVNGKTFAKQARSVTESLRKGYEL